MNKYEKLQQLVAEDAFLNSLDNLKSMDDLNDFLLQHGIELTKEELVNFVQSAGKYEKTDDLSEDDLEKVSGGVTPEVIFGWMWKGGKSVAKKFFQWGQEFAKLEEKWLSR